MNIETVKANVPGIPLKLSRDAKPVALPCQLSKTHIHDDIEILAGSAGIFELTVEGKKIELRAGDVVIVNRRVPHSSASLVPDTLTLMLQFRIEKIRAGEFENINKYLALILASSEEKYVYLPRESAVTQEIFAVINKMYEENTKRESHYALLIEGYMSLLLATLYRNNILTDIEKSYDKDAVRKIWPAIEYVDGNFNKEITLKKLAATLNMNSEYFCRIFKKATGVTPMEYVNFVRIWKAENLLTTTSSSILEVSMESGFSSLSYFNRVFKKLRGSTPSSYRNIIYSKNSLV